MKMFQTTKGLKEKRPDNKRLELYFRPNDILQCSRVVGSDPTATVLLLLLTGGGSGTDTTLAPAPARFLQHKWIVIKNTQM